MQPLKFRARNSDTSSSDVWDARFGVDRHSCANCHKLLEVLAISATRTVARILAAHRTASSSLTMEFVSFFTHGLACAAKRVRLRDFHVDGLTRNLLVNAVQHHRMS